MGERNREIPWKDLFLGFVVFSFFCLSPEIILVLGGAIFFFTPVVSLFYLVKLGWGYGLVILGLTSIFCIFLWPLFTGGSVYYPLIEIFTLGPILFGFLRKGFSATKTVAYATGLLLLLLCTLLIFWSIKTGHNPYQAVVSTIHQELESSLQFYQRLNLSEATLQAMKEALNDMKSVVARFWPGLAAASLLGFVWMNVWLSDRLLCRYGLQGFQFGDLSRWSLPEPLVWLPVSAGGLVVLPYFGPRTVGINLLIFLSLVYFFQGLAIVSFYVKKYGLSRLMRLLLYSLICIQTYMIIIVAMVGLFDVWADFRRLNKAEDKLKTL